MWLNEILVHKMCVSTIVACLLTINVTAQQDKSVELQQPTDPHAHQTEHEDSHPATGWHFMHDGVAFLTVNYQTTPRGATEFVSQNWWMGMGSRSVGLSRVCSAGSPRPCVGTAIANSSRPVKSTKANPSQTISIPTILSCSWPPSGTDPCRPEPESPLREDPSGRPL